MILFLKKSVLLLGLCVLVFLIPVSYVVHIGLRTGELCRLDEIIEKQQKNDILVLPGTYEIHPYLKYTMANMIDPDILILGTSRVHQIRRDFFTPDITFYNTSLAAQTLSQYKDFIESLETNPRFLVFNLDQWHFNPNYLKIDWAKMMDKNIFDYKTGYEYDPIKNFRGIFKLILEGNLKIPVTFNNPQNLGISAVVHGEGWRKDGSYHWKFTLNYQYAAAFIDTGEWVFTYGNEEGGLLSEESINDVEEILRLCNERNIMAVAFFPPFTPSVYQKLTESGHFKYMNELYPALFPLFQKYGYELYDFTASDMVDDSMTFDGWHPDERGTYNILLSIKEQNSALAAYIRPRQ